MSECAPTFSARAAFGAANFLDTYVGLSERDAVVVCIWHACWEPVTWLLYELEQRAQRYRTILYTHRDAERFSMEVRAAVQSLQCVSDGCIAVLVCEEESLSFSPFLRTLNKASGVRVWRMMNTSMALFEQAFATPVSALRNINAWLLSRLMQPQKTSVRVMHPQGTDLSVILDAAHYRWISTYGVPGDDELIILPTGEINMFPAHISGVFVAHGAMHANIALPFDTRLHDKPVCLEIANGVLQRFHCDEARVCDFLHQVFEEPHVVLGSWCVMCCSCSVSLCRVPHPSTNKPRATNAAVRESVNVHLPMACSTVAAAVKTASCSLYLFRANDLKKGGGSL